MATKQELLDDLEYLKAEKEKYEKKLPKGFKRTNPIYQYGMVCAAYNDTLDKIYELNKLEELKNK